MPPIQMLRGLKKMSKVKKQKNSSRDAIHSQQQGKGEFGNAPASFQNDLIRQSHLTN